MLSALVLSLAAVVPAWDGGSASQEAARLEVVARIGETRMSAYNPGDRPQLLILGEIGGTLRVRTWIAPGAQIEAHFPPGTLSGLALEVVSFGAGRITTSGLLPLEPIAAAELDAFWVETDALGGQAWGRSGSSLAALAPGLPGFLSIAPCTPRASTSKPSHVPVITPADRRNGDVPPRLEKRPLPTL